MGVRFPVSVVTNIDLNRLLIKIITFKILQKVKLCWK